MGSKLFVLRGLVLEFMHLVPLLGLQACVVECTDLKLLIPIGVVVEFAPQNLKA